MKCFECKFGEYITCVKDIKTELACGRIIVTPSVAIEECNRCPSRLFDGNACKLIDDEIRKHVPNFGSQWFRNPS